MNVLNLENDNKLILYLASLKSKALGMSSVLSSNTCIDNTVLLLI